jgi:hypothetical protein
LSAIEVSNQKILIILEVIRNLFPSGSQSGAMTTPRSIEVNEDLLSWVFGDLIKVGTYDLSDG